MTGADAIAIIALLTILLAVGVYLLHWLYRHSSKDESFVRTGFGGEKVVTGGGAFVVPIIHDITRVNMNTLPLEIKRVGERSLITRNKMRVDVVAEFSIRVIPTRENIALAARTFGERTHSAELIKEVVQGRFVDSLLTAAASMAMDEIHVGRKEFMRQVSELVAPTLASNGIELENASLTSLNQSDISVFNPDNAFDAEGLTRLTHEIEERRKLKNQIENDARLEIKLKNYQTEQRAIEIDRDLEYARIDQARDIEVRRAAQLAAIEEERSGSAINISNAKIRAEQEAERIRIAKEKLIDAERINGETETRLLEIGRKNDEEQRAIEVSKTLESQRIVSRLEVESRRIEHERRIRELQIASQQEIAIIESNALSRVDQTKLESEKLVETTRIEIDKVIQALAVERDKYLRIISELANTEKETATILKRYNVDVERLKRDEEIIQLEIQKNEKVKLFETAAFRRIEDAAISTKRELDELRIAARKFVEKFEIERNKEVEIIDKERLIAVINKSIEEAVARTEAASAMKALAATEEQVISAREQEAAERAKRVALIEASSRTERETHRLVAIAAAEKEAVEQRALGEIADADAAAVRYAREAEGHARLNEAENMRSEAARRSAIYENLIKNLPSIIRETVKPLESIESIKILQVDGLPGVNSPSETGGNGVASGGNGGNGGNMTDRVVNSAMKYRTQVAFVDGLMRDLGLPIETIGSAGGLSFRNFAPPDPPSDAPKLTKSNDDD